MADDWKRRSDLKSWAISRTCDALAWLVGYARLLTETRCVAIKDG